jgi:superfamily I DNA/RNA helicase
VIAPDEWTPADNLTLEPNAERAARETEHCLALTAGPGAGKTEMLAQRADFLLRTGTCRYPKRILAISFKVDASKNLKERVKRRCGPDLAARFDSYTFHAFAKRIIDRFRLVLAGKDALDVDFTIGSPRIDRKQIEFDDLLPFAIHILETSPIALNAIRQTYTDVFLDEFQDCTEKQYELIKLVFQKSSIRLTAVGDTKQKIMGWAGAMEGIFTIYVDDFDAETLNLYRNFRSKSRLLRMQNEIIRVMDPQSVMPDDQIKGDEGEIFGWSFPTSQDEANQLADLIARWTEQDKIPHSEIAILLRSQVDLYAEHLMAELDKRKIPYRNEFKIQDISVEPVARLIVDYLSCLYGDREPKAWISLMNLIPLLGYDQESTLRQEFQRFIVKERQSVALLESIGDPYKDWWKFAEAFLRHIGIEVLTALSPDYESPARLAEVIKETKKHIDELLNPEPDLRSVLKRFSDDQAVRILTIHKSKGLEFHTVVVLGVEEEAFWGNANESRCTFFVGISRAKERLILTVCERRDQPSGASGNWRVERSYHKEFIDYATPFMKE